MIDSMSVKSASEVSDKEDTLFAGLHDKMLTHTAHYHNTAESLSPPPSHPLSLPPQWHSSLTPENYQLVIAKHQAHLAKVEHAVTSTNSATDAFLDAQRAFETAKEVMFKTYLNATHVMQHMPDELKELHSYAASLSSDSSSVSPAIVGRMMPEVHTPLLDSHNILSAGTPCSSQRVSRLIMLTAGTPGDPLLSSKMLIERLRQNLNSE